MPSELTGEQRETTMAPRELTAADSAIYERACARADVWRDSLDEAEREVERQRAEDEYADFIRRMEADPQRHLEIHTSVCEVNKECGMIQTPSEHADDPEFQQILENARRNNVTLHNVRREWAVAMCSPLRRSRPASSRRPRSRRLVHRARARAPTRDPDLPHLVQRGGRR